MADYLNREEAPLSHEEWEKLDKIVVKTQLDSIDGAQCKVNFWIVKLANNKIASEGYIIYTMISIKNGRPVKIPKDIIEKYSI